MRRNLFDHYSQKENHITNGLLTVLSENPNLFRSLNKALHLGFKKNDFKVLSQRMPKTTDHRDSVIDGTIFSEDFESCIAIESKIVEGTVRTDQLESHLRHLRGFDHGVLWVLTPDTFKSPKLPTGCKHLRIVPTTWANLSKEMAKTGPDKKNKLGEKLFTEFMAYLEREPELSHFNGFRFDFGFDDELARTYVRKITPALKPFIVKHYRGCKNTRQSINLGVPWDAWFSSVQPQESVHPGYSVHPDYLKCVVVIANGCGVNWKSLSLRLQDDESKFLKVLKRVEQNKPKGAEAMISFRQRHYRSQRAVPTVDAEATVAIPVLFGSQGARKNDIWLKLIKDVAKTKNRYNYQMEIGYNIPYRNATILGTDKAIVFMEGCFDSLKETFNYLTK